MVGQRCLSAGAKLGIHQRELGAERLDRHDDQFWPVARNPRGRVTSWRRCFHRRVEPCGFAVRLSFRDDWWSCATAATTEGHIDEGRTRARTHDCRRPGRSRAPRRRCGPGRRRATRGELRHDHGVSQVGREGHPHRQRCVQVPPQRAGADLERSGPSWACGRGRACGCQPVQLGRRGRRGKLGRQGRRARTATGPQGPAEGPQARRDLQARRARRVRLVPRSRRSPPSTAPRAPATTALREPSISSSRPVT